MKHHIGISNIQSLYKMSMSMCEYVIWYFMQYHSAYNLIHTSGSFQ